MPLSVGVPSMTFPAGVAKKGIDRSRERMTVELQKFSLPMRKTWTRSRVLSGSSDP